MKIINYYDEDYYEENDIITITHIYSYQFFLTKPKEKGLVTLSGPMKIFKIH